MKRYISLIALSAILLVGLAACRPAATNSPLIEYHRTGGIAGLDERLVINSDGSAQIVQRGGESSYTLTRAEVDRLIALFSQAGFAKLKKEYLPAGHGADLFDYVVKYRGQSVHTQDTAVPAQVQAILEALNTIIREHGLAR
jgi:hypothetical protein